jgi:AraC-like DNA-binding protein
VLAQTALLRSSKTIAITSFTGNTVQNTTKDDGLASVPAVKQYLRAAEAEGIYYQRYLDQTGISKEVLLDNSKWISASSLERLLALLIKASGNRCFGLHTSQYVSHDMYSVQGYINMNCATLREVWNQTPIYEKIVGDMGFSTPVFSQPLSCLRWSCNYTDTEVRRHITENIIASWYRYVRMYLQSDHPEKRLAKVCFTHDAPNDPELLSEYEDLFCCEVLFNQEHNCICIDSDILDLPIAHANPKILSSLLDHATIVLHELDKNRSYADQVKNLLRLMVSSRMPRREDIAEQMHMSSRTLQRKLKEEGSSYQHVLDELRIELACHYLVKTELALEAIAEKLGFMETRSFYRHFKNYCGKTAGEYRKEHQRIPT